VDQLITIKSAECTGCLECVDLPGRRHVAPRAAADSQASISNFQACAGCCDPCHRAGPKEVGGADGIRIHQLHGNKGVLRRTLAF